MSTSANQPSTAVFSRPRTPAAKCLHLIRTRQIIARSELVIATGLSQPTVTRAVSALIDTGLVHERTDLSSARGRGRPTIPVELAPSPWLHAGVAIGTTSTYIALYDSKGRTFRDGHVNRNVADVSPEDFVEYVIAGLHQLTNGLANPLVSVGVTSSGRVSSEGVVDAPNLGWHNLDLADRLRYQFSVPVIVASAVPALLAAEMQSTELPAPGESEPVLNLFADDTLGAALGDDVGVHSIAPLPEAESELLNTTGLATEETLSTQGFLRRLRDLGHDLPTLDATVRAGESTPQVRELLDERARLLGRVAAELVTIHRPTTLVICGSAFTGDPHAPKLFAEVVRNAAGRGLDLRMIPTHREIVRAVARAAALDQLLREPLKLTPEIRQP
ncbi:ROK family protein [Corynebacterium halotolerans]|uniref:ROK family protein n=1 Tax=Corynebacterium halotolerans TaxID=225326 RepID=UPI003CEAD93F